MKLPNILSPLNLKAYFSNELGACGCSEIDKMQETIIRLLEWHDSDMEKRCSYQELYPETGIFYLLTGRLDVLGLSEHGTSIRYPWLTPEGKRLLNALRNCSAEELHNAKGEAYDGVWHGDLE